MAAYTEIEEISVLADFIMEISTHLTTRTVAVSVQKEIGRI